MRLGVILLILYPFISIGQNPALISKLKLPHFIEQTIVSGDTSIINTTNYKVYKLYDSRIQRFIRFGASLFKGLQVCHQPEYAIRLGTLQFTIQATGLAIDNTPEVTCEKEIDYVGYTTNSDVKVKKNGDYKIVYIKEKKRFDVELGKMEVERRQMQCEDTGNNPVRLTLGGKFIYFKDSKNIGFFEADVDHNEKKEIYLFDFACCSEQLKIYKISE